MKNKCIVSCKGFDLEDKFTWTSVHYLTKCCYDWIRNVPVVAKYECLLQCLLEILVESTPDFASMDQQESI